MACVGGDLSGERDLAGRSSAAVRGCRPHPRWRVRRVRFEEVKRNKTENEKRTSEQERRFIRSRGV